MQTPIVDFVKQYAQSDALRLHMPGHKGLGTVQAYDLTEIDGADVLYAANGIIRSSEENASKLFQTAKTKYSAEGSSLCIRAMLYLQLLYDRTMGRPTKILAARNAHKTFMTAAALLRLDVQWLFSDSAQSILSCEITEDALEAALSEQPSVTAVYLTSPDYLGHIADIKRLSAVCHRYGAMLIVDNAHGAYLRFLQRHPMDLGADLCCDSAHKTLPVLTGGAYLHISQNAPSFFCERAELALSLFASTSPSYLILQSLDEANRYLSDGFAQRLEEFCDSVDALKEALRRRGWCILGDEPLKLTLAPKSYGYTGQAVAQILQQNGIICEFYDADFVVMMLSAELGLPALHRVEAALAAIEPCAPIVQCAPKIEKPLQRMSMHEALFSPSRELPAEECLGKIFASASISCPPAIPILVCGEEIDAQAINCMRYYGITTCRVVIKE